MNNISKVVIVGRKNVGKSTLFNRLSVDVKSLTLDYAGVTRDFLSDIVSWQGVSFELIDSGGISLRKEAEPLAEKVRQIALNLITSADVVIFVVDGKVGVTQEDHEVSKLLHKLNKEVLLAVNKTDAKIAQDYTYDFLQLGHSAFFPISALHGKGIGELLDAIVELASKKPVLIKEEEPTYKVVLLGKPNVGKSSLLNLLLEEERAIVSEEPGTTREAIVEPIHFYKKTIQVTDTPGVRRRRGITEPLEKMMVKTSFRAVEDSDIVLLLIDGTEGKLSDQELKLAHYAFDNYKALILLVNKDDLMDDLTRDDLQYNFDYYESFLKKIPILYISCKTGKNVNKIIPLVHKIWQRYSQWLPEDFGELLKNALLSSPLYRAGDILKLYNARQVKTAPITIAINVNKPQWFGPSQIGFFKNILRGNFDLKGVPIRFVIRKR